MYATPLACHSLGYMLIDVKPGMVLISLTKISLSLPRMRKSTLARPAQSSALNARIDISVILRAISSGSGAGISSSEAASSYFAA